MKTIIIFIISSLLFISNLFSQVTVQWIERYNGPGNISEFAYALAVDNEGNVYVTGESDGGPWEDYTTVKYNSNGALQWAVNFNGTANGLDSPEDIGFDNLGNVYVTGVSEGVGTNDDFATVKYNSSGVQQWVARYNGPGNNKDEPNALVIDGAGNVYVTGRSYGSGSNYDYATIKYNSNGDSVWVNRYNGSGNGSDGASSIAIDKDGNVYVTGNTDVSGTNNYDFATIKYNSNGTQLWATTYGRTGNSYESASAISVDDASNVYVTGSSSGTGTGSDYATIKYNPNGTQLWISIYNGPGSVSGREDNAYELAIDNTGNVYVSGSSDSSGTNRDYATVKYNTDGIQQWVSRYNGPGNYEDFVGGLAIDGNGNVYVTGSSSGTGTGSDYATIKYNPNGTQLWISIYNGPGSVSGREDNAYELAIDNTGNVYVSGSSDSSGTNRDYATVKYNTDGIQQWVSRYNGPGNYEDFVGGLAIDGNGNVYVTGSSSGTGTGSDYITIKYSQTTGIQNISTEIPNGFSLSQNYPNPFNPVTNIEFSIPKQGNIKITVYNSQGKEVLVLLNQRLTPGSYRTDFYAAVGVPKSLQKFLESR